MQGALRSWLHFGNGGVASNLGRPKGFHWAGSILGFRELEDFYWGCWLVVFLAGLGLLRWGWLAREHSVGLNR